MQNAAVAEASMKRPAGVRLLKALQLAVAVALLGLFWLIYPGVPLLIAAAAGVAYVIASLVAASDQRAGIWVAFVFTLLAFAFATWGVYRYFDNGFEYLSGNFPGRTGIYWPAYLFLFIAVGSLAVIVLHASSRRWMLDPRENRGG